MGHRRRHEAWTPRGSVSVLLCVSARLSVWRPPLRSGAGPAPGPRAQSPCPGGRSACRLLSGNLLAGKHPAACFLSVKWASLKTESETLSRATGIPEFIVIVANYTNSPWKLLASL